MNQENRRITFTDCSFSPGRSLDYRNEEPYYSGPWYKLDYSFSDRFYVALSQYESGNPERVISQSVDAWMTGAGLYESDDDNPDPHFAERAFIVNVFLPSYGPNALGSITQQQPFKEFSYQVDFYIQTPMGHVVVEVDGREYHDPLLIGADRYE